MPKQDTIIGSIARNGLTWLSRRRLPLIEGSLKFAGIKSTAEVIRDRWGIPHIYAQDMQDLFFAQGFVHAQPSAAVACGVVRGGARNQEEAGGQPGLSL